MSHSGPGCSTHIGFLLTDSIAILMLFLTVQLKGIGKEVVP